MLTPAIVIVLLLMTLVFVTLPVGQGWKTAAAIISLFVATLFLLGGFISIGV